MWIVEALEIVFDHNFVGSYLRDSATFAFFDEIPVAASFSSGACFWAK